MGWKGGEHAKDAQLGACTCASKSEILFKQFESIFLEKMGLQEKCFIIISASSSSVVFSFS